MVDFLRKAINNLVLAWWFSPAITNSAFRNEISNEKHIHEGGFYEKKQNLDVGLYWATIGRWTGSVKL